VRYLVAASRAALPGAVRPAVDRRQQGIDAPPLGEPRLDDPAHGGAVGIGPGRTQAERLDRRVDLGVGLGDDTAGPLTGI
jgi:hypothetical protein